MSAAQDDRWSPTASRCAAELHMSSPVNPQPRALPFAAAHLVSLNEAASLF